mmetsp:Transcript_9126/g.20585  ORF Transcript_9126/g.20585 Transcript_9126/m.20585 type:complete len:114 (-) Transcript_9126:857-1198(-)
MDPNNNTSGRSQQWLDNQIKNINVDNKQTKIRPTSTILRLPGRFALLVQRMESQDPSHGFTPVEVASFALCKHTKEPSRFSSVIRFQNIHVSLLYASSQQTPMLAEGNQLLIV